MTESHIPIKTRLGQYLHGKMKEAVGVYRERTLQYQSLFAKTLEEQMVHIDTLSPEDINEAIALYRATVELRAYRDVYLAFFDDPKLKEMQESSGRTLITMQESLELLIKMIMVRRGGDSKDSPFHNRLDN